MDLHDEIRRIAKAKHVLPAVSAKREEFSIAVRDLMEEAEAEGISTIQRTPAFCRSIQTRSFLEDNGIRIVKVDGPLSKLSTTVVVHYRVTAPAIEALPPATEMETPEERAFRITERLRGLMKDEIGAHGGAEGYLRWVRVEDGDVE